MRPLARAGPGRAWPVGPGASVTWCRRRHHLPVTTIIDGCTPVATQTVRSPRVSLRAGKVCGPPGLQDRGYASEGRRNLLRIHPDPSPDLVTSFATRLPLLL